MGMKKGWKIEGDKLVPTMVDDGFEELDPEGTSFGLVFKDGVATLGYKNLDQDQIDAVKAEEAKVRGKKQKPLSKTEAAEKARAMLEKARAKRKGPHPHG